MPGSLQRVFEAERLAGEKLKAAQSRAESMEAEARDKAEELVRRTEEEVRGRAEDVAREAEAAAAAHREELRGLVEEDAKTWSSRYDEKRARIVKAIVAAVLGEGARGD